MTSTNNIFGFDGDGIDTYGAPSNPMDNTGYGGPKAYFTNINAGQTSGRVNFITPIPPGGTAYFSLENVLAASIEQPDQAKEIPDAAQIKRPPLTEFLEGGAVCRRKSDGVNTLDIEVVSPTIAIAEAAKDVGRLPVTGGIDVLLEQPISKGGAE